MFVHHSALSSHHLFSISQVAAKRRSRCRRLSDTKVGHSTGDAAEEVSCEERDKIITLAASFADGATISSPGSPVLPARHRRRRRRRLSIHPSV